MSAHRIDLRPDAVELHVLAMSCRRVNACETCSARNSQSLAWRRVNQSMGGSRHPQQAGVGYADDLPCQLELRCD